MRQKGLRVLLHTCNRAIIIHILVITRVGTVIEYLFVNYDLKNILITPTFYETHDSKEVKIKGKIEIL